MCILGNTSKEPGIAGDWETYWDLLTESGSSGTSGTSGSSGTDGSSGSSGSSGEGFVNRGSWSIDTTAYNVNDVVEDNRVVYVCIQDHAADTDNDPGTGVNWSQFWQIWVTSGTSGSSGSSGTNGTDGTSGSSGSSGDVSSLLATSNQWEKAQYFDSTSISSGIVDGSAVISWDIEEHQITETTLTDDTELRVSNMPNGVAYYTIKIINSGSYNLSYSSDFKWAGGTAPTITSSGTDILTFFCDGTYMYGTATQNFT
jgi:hypothetical protein